MTPILFFIALTLLSYLGVWIIRRYAERQQLLDHPNERSSYSMPTPRGGGLAIVLFVTGTGLWFMQEADFSRSLVYIVRGIIIAFLDWRDERRVIVPPCQCSSRRHVVRMNGFYVTTYQSPP